MNPLPSLYECFTSQGVPPEHVEAASTAMSVFLEAHAPAFIAYIEFASSQARVETLRLVSGEA